MPDKEYEVQLDDTELEWLRVRIRTEGGRVTAFTAQYETTYENGRVAVVRYDKAHGFCHRDLLDRRGNEIRKDFIAGDEATVLTQG